MGFAPVSTLIPGTTPLAVSTSANGVPSSARWRIVSSYRITPPMNCSIPAVVNSRFLYARRVSSVDSTPIASKRFAIVPVDSSAARIPLSSATTMRAVSYSSSQAIGSRLRLHAQVHQLVVRVEGGDAPHRPRARAHHDRVGLDPGLAGAHAPQERAAGDAGGGDEDV